MPSEPQYLNQNKLWTEEEINELTKQLEEYRNEFKKNCPEKYAILMEEVKERQDKCTYCHTFEIGLCNKCGFTGTARN